MFFTSGMSVLNKPDKVEDEDDDEEVDVFSKSREVEVAKSYSMETAIRYVYGQGFGIDVRVLTDEEREANERARYCRQQLLRLKARRATLEAGEADTLQILQQEEVEAWLANIELRIREQTRQLGIKPNEIPIWITPTKKNVGNIASAATAAAAAAAAIRKKLKSKELSQDSSSGRSTPSIDKAAAIAALTDLMEELEELGNSARESDSESQKEGSRRSVRFLTPHPFPTPRPSPFQSPRSSPFSTPRSSPFQTPRSSPSTENVGIRSTGIKKACSSETLVQKSKVEQQTTSLPQKPPKPKKTKASNLALTTNLRPSSSLPQPRTEISTKSVPVSINKQSKSKGYVSRRRGSENSPLTQPFVRCSPH